MTVRPPMPSPTAPGEGSWSILFEDAHCLAVAKPSGLLTQGKAGGEPTLEDSVRRHLDPGAPGSVYLGTVHRLDRPVSGVVLWAKTPKSARRLSAAFAAREAVKEYWAIVEVAAGEAVAEGTWDDWLTPPDDSGVARVVGPETPGARRAVTRASPGPGATLPAGTAWLRLRPETGRTHQLRVQAAHRGLPILGDARYGASRAWVIGIALHARALTVRHPTRLDELRLVAPTPSAWRAQGIGLPNDPA